MLDELNRKRILLYKLIDLDLEQINSEEILKISEELDKLIIEYYRKHKEGSKNK